MALGTIGALNGIAGTVLRQRAGTATLIAILRIPVIAGFAQIQDAVSATRADARDGNRSGFPGVPAGYRRRTVFDAKKTDSFIFGGHHTHTIAGDGPIDGILTPAAALTGCTSIAVVRAAAGTRSA